uniref:4F5 domain-containing protein n=1 Tax=Anopheles maculatus TaxID=74869 RepID=A0A182T4Y6_9DIPT
MEPSIPMVDTLHAYLRCSRNCASHHHTLAMARGHQKIQSQQKAQEKAAKMKKQQGHGLSDQMKAAQKALVFSCAMSKRYATAVTVARRNKCTTMCTMQSVPVYPKNAEEADGTGKAFFV